MKDNGKIHGTLGGHRRGCRCKLCIKAYNDYARKYRQSRNPESDSFPHGKVTGYSSGCRCDKCMKAVRDKPKEDGFNHGMTGYNYGCRCDVCRKAKADYRRVPEKELKKGIDPSSPRFPHGKFAVAARCKCEICVEAAKKYSREDTAKRMKNPEFAEKARERKALYKQTSRGKRFHRENQRRRIADLAERTDNLEMVKKIYLACPDGYTVDHIKAVSKGGRHAPENLQYLPNAINAAKGNRDNYDYSEHVIRWQNILVEPSTTRA